MNTDGAGARQGGPVPPRGRLKVYLGAAPGVGKTYRMLDEARRRAARGTDVVIGSVRSHGRPHTEALLDRLLETMEYVSLDDVLVRRPREVLVDDLAHPAEPDGSRPAHRRVVEEFLAAGIDVVTTLNIQHLESLKDVVEKITGTPQHDTVPDDVVRRADQIELVDMPPDALRRRMAHGDIHPPERIDAALGHYFREGNLTALRELALLWVADRVDEKLRAYRSEHRIEGVWQTRERVVVALPGGSEGETLIRRAARIADRAAHAELLAVHVVRSDGLAAGSSHGALARQRQLVESLGGTYHSVVGAHVPSALVQFAHAENATQLVLGTSRRGRWERFLTGRGTGDTAVALCADADIDVRTVAHERAGGGRLLPSRRRTLTTARLVAGPVAGLVLPVLLTFLLDRCRGTLNLTSEALLYLVTVLGVACIGGVASALVGAVTASLLLNYWFIPPTGRFTVAEPDNLLALAVFMVVAGTVAAMADRSLRLSRRAARATAEAETMSALAGSIVRGDRAIEALLTRARETFAVETVELAEERSEPDGPGITQVPVGDGLFLVLRGRTLDGAERRVLTAFAAHVAAAVERDRLAEAAAEAEPIRAADRMRTALLAAVSHDLRTPLAVGWAAVGSLRSPDVEFTAEERDELLATAEESMARLGRLIDNLLDLSRLQAGALTLALRPTAFDEVLPAALEGLPEDGAEIVVVGTEAAPTVLSDPPLLERVIANVVSNAVRHSPPDRPVRISVSALADRVELRVADRGPGLPYEDRDRAFVPFQRLGDTDNTRGVGLGLALARGLTEAMGGTLTPEDTPGGGLTMVVSLPGAGGHAVSAVDATGTAAAAPDERGRRPRGRASSARQG
ncbi:ATP-binding protein [Streptomyces sp. NPDC087440]|uniref:ATP-binding protein n=1 Tax=Streptomyces sp. NPDC087440 TaxID=3365790 RepID=UPI0037FC6231